MPKPRPTVDEIIATLQRSSDPALLAEGIDDLIFLRKLEDRFEGRSLSVLPLGGRDAVLKVFDRRSEIPSGKIILFMADQDFWIYSGIPSKYLDDTMIFSDGYSIENDLYRYLLPERLLSLSEKSKFLTDLERFVEWYAIAICRNLSGTEASWSDHPNTILDDPVRFAADTKLQLGEKQPAAELASLKASYQRLIRGKSLMALLTRQLSSQKRAVKHNSRSLMEHGAVADGIWAKRISDWIESSLPQCQSVDK